MHALQTGTKRGGVRAVFVRRPSLMEMPALFICLCSQQPASRAETSSFARHWARGPLVLLCSTSDAMGRTNRRVSASLAPRCRNTCSCSRIAADVRLLSYAPRPARCMRRRATLGCPSPCTGGRLRRPRSHTRASLERCRSRSCCPRRTTPTRRAGIRCWFASLDLVCRIQ